MFPLHGRVIVQHGGTIDKFIGDCVMALFGVPKTLEDGPQRAIETALEMKNRLLSQLKTKKNIAVTYTPVNDII
jgi:class 3 adenylate cyclase